MAFQSVDNWAHSHRGVNIPMHHSRGLLEGALLWIGGVHGDEPEGVELAMGTFQWLRSHHGKVQFPWALIPCLNPDGLTAKTRTNARGVDLNRNYPSRDWSQEHPKSRYYPGPQSESEPEVQSLVKLIEQIKPRMIVHCHSWKPCVVYAGSAARQAAETLGAGVGYEVRDDIGYPTPGSLSSYAFHDKNIPVICIEEQEGTPLRDVWPHFSEAVEKIFLHPSAMVNP
jgi:predicted deacylase